MERNERIEKAYKYLQFNGIIHSQSELAEKMGINRTSVTLAINGDPRYTTDSFIKNLSASFPGVFNLQWLLNGEGCMTMDEEAQRDRTTVQDIIALSAQLIKQNEDLRALLIDEIRTTSQLRQELTAAIAELRAASAICQIKFDNSPSTYLAEKSKPSPKQTKKQP